MCVLQCGAECRSLVQCVAVCCSLSQYVLVSFVCPASSVVFVCVCCSVLQSVAVCCSLLQSVAVCSFLSSALPHAAFPYVCHDSFICVPCLIHMCAMPHSCVCRDSFICVPCLIHMCAMTHSYVCHYSFICVPCLSSHTYVVEPCKSPSHPICVWALQEPYKRDYMPPHMCVSPTRALQKRLYASHHTQMGLLPLVGSIKLHFFSPFQNIVSFTGLFCKRDL